MPDIVEGSIFDYESYNEQAPFNSPLGRFAALVKLPDAEIDLAEGALIIAGQEYVGLNESFYLDRLDDLADEIRPVISAEIDPLKNIQHLNHFLSDQKGFRGNEAQYYDRRNSFLNDVLDRKTGIPISLSLLYIELGKRLGLHFEGIGLPGHFIIRYRHLAPQRLGRSESFNSGSDSFEWQTESSDSSGEQGRDILLDPFHGGALLSEEDCADLIKQRYGQNFELDSVLLQGVSNRQFLSRILTNLKGSCINDEDFDRALQYQEYLQILNPNSIDEVRSRAALYLQTGRYGRAIAGFQAYLRKNPDAPDIDSVRKELSFAYNQMVRRN